MARWRTLVVLIAVAALCVGVAQTGFGQSLLRKAGLSEASASYTALAFTQPQSLPSQLPSKRMTMNVSFAIRNASGRDRSYQWSVLLSRDGRSHRIATGSAWISSGAGATVTRAVAVSCAGGQVRVVVSLASPAESIDYLAACWTRGGRGS
jgi:hypothetical protein